LEPSIPAWARSIAGPPEISCYQENCRARRSAGYWSLSSRPCFPAAKATAPGMMKASENQEAAACRPPACRSPADRRPRQRASLTWSMQAMTRFPCTKSIPPLGNPAAAVPPRRDRLRDWSRSISSGDVSAYAVDATTGALIPVGPPVAAGATPVSVSIDSNGRIAYVTNLNAAVESAFAIDPGTGELTALGTTRAPGGNPFSAETATRGGR